MYIQNVINIYFNLIYIYIYIYMYKCVKEGDLYVDNCMIHCM